MAKDDYFVIVYQVLSYLYKCLKSGKSPDLALLDGSVFGVGEEYWAYILSHLYQEGYIEGIRPVKVDGADNIFANMNKIAITPKGIQYLSENTVFEKAKAFLKDVKGSIPFL